MGSGKDTKNKEDEEKPKRLYFKSYLQVIRNSVGSKMFRNFYVQTSKKGEFDAFADGENSCAFFVSAILVIFKKLDDIHGTVQSLVEDLKKSGWQEVDQPRPGDVIVWRPINFAEGPVKHVGFAISGDQAISTSWKERSVVKHDIHFGDANRQIEQIFRMQDWDNDAQTG